ncbi:hypothetical protein ABZS66_47650 [Dactylosporangium sp. NPDC005572]|uniref:hypothetical protein n=1 Tax=Dactylosporangium sp. NPDC005572 TaxID=3156889 RepID=UPI0033B51F77
MPKLVDAARITSPGGTVWRTCAECTNLAPLPPAVDRCDACRLGPGPTAPDGGEAR